MSAALPVRRVAKPWGRTSLPPPFDGPSDEAVGEIWFEPPPALPQLLVKYIFTSQALSVQVHPSDHDAPGQGKEECWLVIAAEPGARIGIGLQAVIGPDALRAAALDGSIEGLLRWFPVEPGDFFHIPAGTVHAIGAGVSLIEVQQNSDTTYRLYDYGRPRDLHLDAGIAVARAAPWDEGLHQRLAPLGPARLVEGPAFRLDRIDDPRAPGLAARYGAGPLLVVPLAGEAVIGRERLLPGACGLAPRLADLALAGQALIAQPVIP